MSSLRHDYSDDEARALADWLDAVYQDFVGKAAHSRGMTADEVHEVAKGRVWTGEQALRRGLVDQLGGTRVALDSARHLAGLHRTAPVREVTQTNVWHAIRGPRTADDPGTGAAVWAGDWGPFAAIATQLGLPGSGPLALPWPGTGIR